MPGFNHYSNCPCGWCVKFGRARARFRFDAEERNARVILRELGYREGSFVSCFVNPNARCPICKERVFFYANVFGSRVFFDNLGRPWKKHPCTDKGQDPAQQIPTPDYPKISRRVPGLVDQIIDSLAAAHIDPREQHREKWSRKPEGIFVVEQVFSRGPNHWVRASELAGGDGSEAFLKFTSGSFTPRPGDLLSTDGETVSTPERADSFRVTMMTAAEFESATGVGS